MTKLKWFLSAVVIVLFASCTGGNESIIGKPTVVDYLPSALMIIGGVGMVAGLVSFLTGGVPKPFAWSGIGTAAKTIFFWSLIIFVFGVCVYYFS